MMGEGLLLVSNDAEFPRVFKNTIKRNKSLVNNVEPFKEGVVFSPWQPSSILIFRENIRQSQENSYKVKVYIGASNLTLKIVLGYLQNKNARK